MLTSVVQTFISTDVHMFFCTKFGADTSSFANIMASVIQGSSLGPASFIVTAADLHPLQPGNVIIKFADDIYRNTSNAGH